MDARSRRQDARVTPTGAAQHEPSRLQIIVDSLIKHGVQPIMLNDGNCLTTQDERTESGFAYLVVEGGLHELVRLDERQPKRVTCIQSYGPGQIVFLQGLFEAGSWGGTQIAARTTLVADEHTIVFPVDLATLKRTLFPVTIMRGVYNKTCMYLELLLTICSESDFELLAAEDFFEKREILRNITLQQFRKERIRELEETLSLEQARVHILEKRLERLRADNRQAEAVTNDPDETPGAEPEGDAAAVHPEPEFLPGADSLEDAEPDGPPLGTDIVSILTRLEEGPDILITGIEEDVDITPDAPERTDEPAPANQAAAGSDDRSTTGYWEDGSAPFADSSIPAPSPAPALPGSKTLLGIQSPTRQIPKEPAAGKAVEPVLTKTSTLLGVPSPAKLNSAHKLPSVDQPADEPTPARRPPAVVVSTLPKKHPRF